MNPQPTIYMIGTTHFDPVWMWTWDEAMASIRSTFRSALDRMNEDPNFVYSFSCPPVFEWVRKVDPGQFAEIRQRVREGRWDLVEGWWVQPDCNLCHGESYVRQGLYGQRYLAAHFGQMASTAFNTDSFGHSAMLPQIYRKSGIRAHVFGRPSAGQKELPGPLFAWRSPDGSTVLAFRCGSDGANSYPTDVKASLAALRERMPERTHDMAMLYGVSNHGGAPTRQALADINAAMRDDTDAAAPVCFSSAAAFFDRQDAARLPVVEDELQVDDFGVFCNHSATKTLNRRAEYALLNAEKFALLADLLQGADDAHGALTAGWHDVLFNQFHDILGGASVKGAYVDARNLHGRALQTANEVTHYALQSMTREIDTAGEGFPLVVWNPNTFEVETAIEGELQWAWEFPWYSGALTLRGPDGETIPCQIIHEHSGLPRFRSRFVFRDTLPSLGYKVYTVYQDPAPEADSGLCANHSPNGRLTLENDHFRVSIDHHTGGIRSVFDKSRRREIVTDAAIARVLDDRGDTWAFNIDRYGPELGVFQMESAELIECGPVRSRIRTKARFGDSTLVQDFLLDQDGDTLEGRFCVHWREQRRALKLCFTAGMTHPTVTSAIPYGSIQRPNDGREFPAGEWLDLSQGDAGVALLTDSIFSYDVQDSIVGLTVLRSPIYAHHGHPMQKNHIDESKDWDIMEQGVREGAWQLRLHDGDWRAAAIPRHATAFNNPVITIDEAAHAGTRPRQNSFFTVESTSVMVHAVKKSEDDDNLVLRMVEFAGRDDEVTICIKPIDRIYKLILSKYEIKTVMLARNADYALIETDMLEREVARQCTQ